MACNNCNGQDCICDIGEELTIFFGDGSIQDADVNELEKNLPSIIYVSSQISNYVFSDGIVATEQETIDKFLSRENAYGENNENILREAIRKSIVHGSCGVRIFEENLYLYEKGNYAKIELSNEETGIKSIYRYIVNKDGLAIDSESVGFINSNNQILDETAKNTVLETIKNDSSIIEIETKNFFEITFSGTEDTSSPLEKDKRRFNLLNEIYKRAEKDARNDGPVRLILHQSKDTNAKRTSLSNYAKLDKRTVEGNTASEIRTEIDNISGKQITAMLKAYEKSGSSQVLYADNFFSEKVTFLPRTTNLSDFKWILDKEDELTCRAFRVNPALVGIGRMNGNISMEYVISNDMKNSIIPMRKSYENQFKRALCLSLGVSDIRFGDYIPEVENTNIKRKELLELIELAKELDLTEQIEKLTKELNDTFIDEFQKVS